MTRFNDIVIREGYQTVEVGAGLAWTDVYKYLIPKGFNVVGAGADGVGVAGLALGGGECHSPPSGSYRKNLSVYACGRIFLENKPIWAHGGHRHGIPPCITKWNANGSDRDGQRSLVCTQGMFDMAMEGGAMDLLFTRIAGRI
jgi:hypothetical protein